MFQLAMHRENRINQDNFAFFIFTYFSLFSFLALKCEMKSRKAARNTKKQYILHLAKIKKRENIIVDFSSSF